MFARRKFLDRLLRPTARRPSGKVSEKIERPRRSDLPGEAVSRRTLVAAVGGLGFDLDPRVVDIHVVRLMLAIGEDAGVRIMRTADRAGYVLSVDGASAAG